MVQTGPCSRVYGIARSRREVQCIVSGGTSESQIRSLTANKQSITKAHGVSPSADLLE